MNLVLVLAGCVPYMTCDAQLGVPKWLGPASPHCICAQKCIFLLQRGNYAMLTSKMSHCPERYSDEFWQQLQPVWLPQTLPATSWPPSVITPFRSPARISSRFIKSTGWIANNWRSYYIYLTLFFVDLEMLFKLDCFCISASCLSAPTQPFGFSSTATNCCRSNRL